MLTRKGLVALADGIAEAAARHNIDPHDLAKPILHSLRAAGQVTPNFDPGRFDTYLSDQFAALNGR